MWIPPFAKNLTCNKTYKQIKLEPEFSKPYTTRIFNILAQIRFFPCKSVSLLSKTCDSKHTNNFQVICWN